MLKQIRDRLGRGDPAVGLRVGHFIETEFGLGYRQASAARWTDTKGHDRLWWLELRGKIW